MRFIGGELLGECLRFDQRVNESKGLAINVVSPRLTLSVYVLRVQGLWCLLSWSGVFVSLRVHVLI